MPSPTPRTSHAARARELAELIREQAADLARPRLLPHPRERREADLPAGRGERFDLDEHDAVTSSMARRGAIPAGFLVLTGDGVVAWSGLTHDAVRVGATTCPVCEGRPLPPSTVCGLCDRAGVDGRELPGLPVGSAMSPDYPAEATAMPEADGLAGGTEATAPAKGKSTPRPKARPKARAKGKRSIWDGWSPTSPGADLIGSLLASMNSA